MFSNSHLPLINKPTRITSSSATLIDNIIRNSYDLKVQQGILFDDSTDHLPDFRITQLNNSPCIIREDSQCYRNITKQTISNFKQELATFNGNDVYSIDDPNIAFTSHFSYMYNKHFPLKKAQPKKKLKSWMTDSILKSINSKNKLYRKFLKRPNAEKLWKYDLANTRSLELRKKIFKTAEIPAPIPVSNYDPSSLTTLLYCCCPATYYRL